MAARNPTPHQVFADLDLIVAMQHVIREVRHELGNLGFEERLNTAYGAERKTG